MDKWIEKQLSERPLTTIIIVSAVGVAFLLGVGVLSPIVQLGRNLRGGSFGQGAGTKNPGVPAGSAKPTVATAGGGSPFAP